jgi:RNase P/RNase MRP subunit p29
MSITNQNTDLVGLKIIILKSSDPTHVGITGVIRFETLNMFELMKADGSVKMLEKKVLLLKMCDSGRVLDCARIKNIYSRSTITSYEHKN